MNNETSLAATGRVDRSVMRLPWSRLGHGQGIPLRDWWHSGYIVATGTALGFGTASSDGYGLSGYLPSHHDGSLVACLDPADIPGELWIAGDEFPRSARPMEQRAVVGLCADHLRGHHVVPMLMIHTGTTMRTPKTWTSVGGRGIGAYRPERWIAFGTLLKSMPAEWRREKPHNVEVTGLPQPADGSTPNGARCGRSGSPPGWACWRT